MMSFFVCAGLLGLLAVALLSNVGRVRGKTKIFIGDGGNTELITAMRAQANFVENVPLGLILIWLVGTFYGVATVATLSVLLVRGAPPARDGHAGLSAVRPGGRRHHHARGAAGRLDLGRTRGSGRQALLTPKPRR